ncbi:cell division protein FtsQ/DivIB [Alloscardovia criceti]|uniref:cell division protein FtsQ/DivIB n=1 Tax=Alloscardovia criceti TaxID=356828 RepID=UPI000A033E0C|nr:FtsQ-type POTRA domain-containing protein [Alloscardovia criceti]
MVDKRKPRTVASSSGTSPRSTSARSSSSRSASSQTEREQTRHVSTRDTQNSTSSRTSLRERLFGQKSSGAQPREKRIVRASSMTADAQKSTSRKPSEMVDAAKIIAREEARTRKKTINFEQRKAEQRQASRRFWALRIFIAVISVAVLSFAVWALIFSPWLKVQSSKIYISGANNWVNLSNVREYTDQTIDTSLFLLSETDLQTKIDDVPGVQSVTVTKEYPHGLNIAITEETPAALLYAEDAQDYVAVDGQAQQISTKKEPTDGIPVINVPTANSGLRNESVVQAIAVLAGLDDNIRGQVTETIANTQDSITTVLNSGYTVVWGNSGSIETKQKIVEKIIEQLQGEGNTSATIDVSAPSRPIIK